MNTRDASPAAAEGSLSCATPPDTIHGLVALQAARRPQAAALVHAGGEITYAELAARSGSLATLLRRQGVRRGDLVGLAAERGPDAVVAMLAILEAGAAYLPLDPGYPAERLAQMMADARPVLVLAQAALRTGLPAAAQPVLVLEEALAAAQEDSADQASGLDPAPVGGDDLAYVCFTSGSTGRPKGVAVPHRGVVRLVDDPGYVDLGPGETVLQVAPLAFDAATFEVWGALANGTRLVLPPAGRLTLAELARWVAEHGVTTLHLTAGLFQQFVDAHPETLAGVRQLLTGGDVVSAPHVRRALARVGERVVACYGPTESTTFTSCHAMSADRAAGEAAADAALPGDTVPIGRPIRATRVVLLDAEGRPVAEPGAGTGAGTGAGAGEGELAIAGDGLARGYLGRPAATAERFVPDPTAAAGAAGGRLYRTGDLARRRADGVLEFLGRLDDQVKIRGFRVEPGEVEAVLAGHPAVAGAAVLALPASGGGKRLVAFAASASTERPEGRPAGRDLRAWLAERLPEYMVPASVVVIDELPLTANQKVDRRALAARAPGSERPDLPTPFALPRTATEARVAAIYAEMLGMDEVGADDDLFELGGHSLAATRIAARLREETGVELPMTLFFTHPTPAAVAAEVDRQAAAPAAPATASEGGSGEAPLAAGPVPRGDHPGPLPVAFPQERVWFLQQMEPQSRAYHFQAELRFRGALDVVALRAALQEIIRRHEAFRTTFPAHAGQPVQVVHPPFAVRLPVVDLSALPAARRYAEARREMFRLVGDNFDLAALPLVHWTAFRLDAADHAVLHVEHHLIHDGWAFNVFLEELAVLYRAVHEGRPSPLADPALQFADFAVWQRRWGQSEEFRAQVEHWCRVLTPPPPPLDLPLDRPRPRAQSFRGTNFRYYLPAETSAALRGLARRHGATIYEVLLAGFLALMHRTTGQEDFAVGSGLANRRFRSIERMLGMLVNTVVLRADLAGDPTLAELLARVRRTTRDTHANQDAPLQQVVARLRPDRDASHNPFFQVSFSFHDAPLAGLHLPEVTLDAKAIPNGSAKFDLNVIAVLPAEQSLGQDVAGDQEVELIWEYSTDLFDAATVRGLVERYRRLLDGLLATPGARISELPLLGDAERRLLLEERCATAEPLPPEPTVAHRVARRAAERPEAPAVLDATGEGAPVAWSYGELRRRALAIAERLTALGAGPETVVALALPRSAELVASALGTFEAGAAYLPLDVSLPAERLLYMLADARPAVVVARGEVAERLAAAPGAPRVLRLEALGAPAAAAGGTRSARTGWAGTDAAAMSEPAAVREGLAYVIYTSGSTGRPKGTLLGHAGLLNLAAWHGRVHGLGADSRATMLAGTGFDASVWEVWSALAAGAELCLPPASVLTAPAELAAWLDEHGITHTFLATPLAEAVLADLEHGTRPPAALRVLATGGDRLHRFPGRELPFTLANHYGPTEATVVGTWTPVPARPEGRRTPAAATGAAPTIGRPLPNTRAYVVDASLRLVPQGVAGELLLGGVGIARGYLGRPALTAERFVPDPFAAPSEPGGRLYRTGDRVRWLGRGELEFLGRIDQQVQVRGYRVELGEIEAVLAEHPAIREAAVLALPSDAGADTRLVAFVVPDGPVAAVRDAAVRDTAVRDTAVRDTAAEPSAGAEGSGARPQAVPVEAGELARWLRGRLPEYMVPASFAVVPELPLNASGKVDRRELERRVGEAAAAAPAREHLAPRTEVEEILALVWSELLGSEGIGVHDHFFDLGGHSLHATRLVHRVRELLDIELPVRCLYDAPVLEDLANLVEERLLADLAEEVEQPGLAV